MTVTLFIRFHDPIIGTTSGNLAVEWLLLQEQDEVRNISTGLVSLAQGMQDVLGLQETISQVVVLIPGEHVLITSTPVHRKQKNQIATALHYAVEDQLAASVDSVHAALGRVMPNSAPADIQSYLVAVVKKDIMDTVLNALKTVQIVPDVVTSDAFLMPFYVDHINILLEQDRALLSAAPSIIASVEPQNLLFLLSSYIQTVGAPPSILNLYSSATATHDSIATSLKAWATKHALSFEHFVFDEPPLVQLCHNYSSAPPQIINLLQGTYKTKKKRLHQWVNVKTLAMIVFVFFVLNTLLAIGKTYYFQSKAETLHALSLKEYHTLFPEDPRIVDLKAQMQQHLNQYSKQADDKNFLVLLSQLATKLGHSWPNQIIMRSMGYDEEKGTLILNIQAPDMAQLETFKKLLTSSSLINNMDSVSQSGDVVKGRITVGGSMSVSE